MKAILSNCTNSVLLDPNQCAVPIEIRRNSENPETYSDLDQRQHVIADRVRAGGRGALLLTEVAPVITFGRRTPKKDILFSEEILTLHGIGLCPTDRGGLATYHGPGQWILFPVDRLEALTGDRRGVRKAVQGLLEIALRVGQAFLSGVHIREGCEMGVWSDQGKFAAVGIHIERGVLQHGLAINGFRTSTSFQGLRPCGLDAPVDFLLKSPDEIAFVELGKLIVNETFQGFWRESELTRGVPRAITSPEPHIRA